MKEMLIELSKILKSIIVLLFKEGLKILKKS